MDLLSKRIAGSMERFTAFSGLSGLAAINLYIKNERGIHEAPTEGKVSDHIKSGDTIFFDLKYEEIWIDVEMTLNCKEKEHKIFFSVKTKLNEKITNFKESLISISINLWSQLNKEDDNIVNLFYLLKNFEIEGSRKLDAVNELENTLSKNSFKSELVKDKYTFDSKIKCKAGFININEHILNIFKFERMKEFNINNEPYYCENKRKGFIKTISYIKYDIYTKIEDQVSENLTKMSIVWDK